MFSCSVCTYFFLWGEGAVIFVCVPAVGFHSQPAAVGDNWDVILGTPSPVNEDCKRMRNALSLKIT
jgi:hypothetical protein